jgi:hypothetical protein
MTVRETDGVQVHGERRTRNQVIWGSGEDAHQSRSAWGTGTRTAPRAGSSRTAPRPVCHGALRLAHSCVAEIGRTERTHGGRSRLMQSKKYKTRPKSWRVMPVSGQVCSREPALTSSDRAGSHTGALSETTSSAAPHNHSEASSQGTRHTQSSTSLHCNKERPSCVD